MVGWGNTTEGYECGVPNNCCADITFGSDIGIDLSVFDMDSEVRPAFFASSAANVERTEVMIN